MRRQAWFLLALLCLVVLCEAVGSQAQDQTVNLRPGSVSSAPGTPPVRVRADKERVPLGTKVTFTLSPDSVLSDYVVTLYFGDRQRQVMTGPQAIHVYENVGNYTYSVDVKSRRQCDARVALKSSANSIPAAQPVTFSAEVSGNCSNIQYRFVFGDGSPTVWSSSAQAEHRYARAGNYFPYVDISDGKSRIGGSQRLRLQVTSGTDNDPRNKVSVSLAVDPLPAQPGKPVTFTAKASPARAGARYEFNFGDGDRTSWQTDPQSTHTYKTLGVYRPYVQVSQFVNNQSVSATSAPTVLRVRRGNDPTDPDPSPTPTPRPDTSPSPSPGTSPAASNSPTPSPGNGSPSPGDGSPSPGASPSGSNGTTVTGGETPTSSPSVTPNPNGGGPGNKWWYLLIAAIILFLIYQVSGLLFATQPTFAPFSDHGVAAVAQEKGALPIDFELVLDRNVSGGDYSVTTDEARLVKNSPEPEDRQVIEI